MTHEEIRAAIQADPALKQLALEGQDGPLAKLLPPTITTIEYRLTSLKVLDLFGPIRGADIMQTLRASNDKTMKELIPHMDRAGVNIGHKEAAKIINGLVPNVLTLPESAAILALARLETPLHYSEVAKALKPLRREGRIGQEFWLGN